MRRSIRIAALLAALSFLASDALASGVGASIYVPGRAQHPSVQQASCQTGTCGPHAGCDGCKRLGFACVDHATPPPCTAEGGCYPKRNTWGYHTTKWRRWPGAVYGGPAPETAGSPDDLPVIEPPTPADEDKSSPPPIEDTPSPEDEGVEDGDFEPAPPAFRRELPGVEIDLPPLPEVAPPSLPRPAGPGFQDSPPALPFGFNEPSQSPNKTENWAPSRPTFGTTPTVLRKPASQNDPPPPLPAGFTGASPTELLRRLPTTRPAGRYDAAVQPASAYQPVR